MFAAILFLVLFAVHLWQVVYRRSWYFLIFPIGLLFEVVGYINRSLSARSDPYNLIYFVLNYFFIVTAPVFLAAGIYVILSALMRKLGNNAKLILWIFITSDIVATVTQITGASLIGVKESRKEDATTANNILLAGLAFQVFTMGMYVWISSRFIFCARRKLVEIRLATFTIAFYTATILVYLRTCFRLAETSQGLDGYLSTHEAFFGALEFAPIALAVILLAIWHPGRCVSSNVLESKGDIEMVGPTGVADGETG